MAYREFNEDYEEEVPYRCNDVGAVLINCNMKRLPQIMHD